MVCWFVSGLLGSQFVWACWIMGPIAEENAMDNAATAAEHERLILKRKVRGVKTSDREKYTETENLRWHGMLWIYSLNRTFMYGSCILMRLDCVELTSMLDGGETLHMFASNTSGKWMMYVSTLRPCHRWSPSFRSLTLMAVGFWHMMKWTACLWTFCLLAFWILSMWIACATFLISLT